MRHPQHLTISQQIVEEYEINVDNLTANVLRQYIWGQYIDELIQQREYENKPDGQEFVDWYPVTDLLHRTVALTDNNICKDANSDPFHPNFVEVYDTDVYGRTRAYRDPGPDGIWFTDDDIRTFKPKCKYLFTGREYDAETGLYYYRARYYHPELGVFTSRDPLLYDGGDMNLYRYCGGNPLIHVDPDGEFIWFIVGAVVVGIAAWSAFGPKVSKPGLGESLIPVWGSGKNAIYDFQHGEIGWGIFNTVMAATDVFLVRSLAGGIGKLLAKEVEVSFSKQVIRDVGSNVAEGTWKKLRGGMQVKRVGNYFIKEVDTEASRLAQWWGRKSLQNQASALAKLGDMAPNFLYRSGRLIARNAGAYETGTWLKTFARGSWRLGTVFNDIFPRNIGRFGVVFDPVWHPVQELLIPPAHFALKYLFAQGEKQSRISREHHND